MPNIARRTDGFGGESAAAWDVHMAAKRRADRGEDVLILSVGDPDFDTPASIVDTAVEALRSGRTHYSETTGEPALRQAIAERHHAGHRGSRSRRTMSSSCPARSAACSARRCACSKPTTR